MNAHFSARLCRVVPCTAGRPAALAAKPAAAAERHLGMCTCAHLVRHSSNTVAQTLSGGTPQIICGASQSLCLGGPSTAQVLLSWHSNFQVEFYLNQMGMKRQFCPAYSAFAPRSCSMRMSWLYLFTRSDLQQQAPRGPGAGRGGVGSS